MSTLSLNWGMLLLEPLFGTPLMATLGSFPKIQIFQTFPTKQGRKSYSLPMLLTKEPCLTFVAVEQPSIFKPCQKFTASPFPYSMMFKQETGLLKTFIEVHTLEIQVERQRFKG